MNPSGATAFARSRFRTPGSTHARRSSGRTSRIRSIFDVTTTSASPIGVAPPARPVPEPRGTTGRACRAATCMHATTSSTVWGKATRAHPPSTIAASLAYRVRASGSERTSVVPRASSSSRRAASTSAMATGTG